MLDTKKAAIDSLLIAALGLNPEGLLMVASCVEQSSQGRFFLCS
jgi:hypothetical protein